LILSLLNPEIILDDHKERRDTPEREKTKPSQTAGSVDAGEVLSTRFYKISGWRGKTHKKIYKLLQVYTISEKIA